MEEKREVKAELKSQSRFLKWLDNFWYHYKWQTLAAVFILFVVAVCVGQCSSVKKSDMTVSFGGAYTMSDAEQNAFRDVLGIVMPEDFDGNGEKTAALAMFSIYTEEELEKLYTYYDEVDETYKVDRSSLSGAIHYNTERIENLYNYVMTGECAVWFISPYVYETMFEGKVNIVEKAELKDTAFYNYYDAVKVLPQDTLIVLTQPVMGNMAKEENYRDAVDYYHAILNFIAP